MPITSGHVYRLSANRGSREAGAKPLSRYENGILEGVLKVLNIWN